MARMPAIKLHFNRTGQVSAIIVSNMSPHASSTNVPPGQPRTEGRVGSHILRINAYCNVTFSALFTYNRYWESDCCIPNWPGSAHGASDFHQHLMGRYSPF